MNVYLIGMLISMILYMVIGYFVSKKVKDADDYYVAGRRAPVSLLCGSLVASYIGTGLYTGDAAWSYEGGFTVGAVGSIVTVTGIMLGVIIFGRFLRRLKVVTIPEFFEKRFQSKFVGKIASVVCILTMGVYMISVSQGVGALLNGVTGIDMRWCILLAIFVFTFVAVLSGSNGVLITDTIMSSIFVVMTLIGVYCIAKAGGGLYKEIADLTTAPETLGWFGAGGPPGFFYGSAAKNLTWAGFTAIVWFGVCAVSPWETSRYLMAKIENAAIRAAFPAMIGVAALHFFVVLGGALVKILNPSLEDSSLVLIWAAMNVMPTIIGVLVLTGILAAGISSATTFLSQVGTNIVKDFVPNTKHPIATGRIAMLIVAAIVVIYNFFAPPSVFWVMMLGGAICTSAFLPTAVGSIFSKRMTKTAAAAAMICGFSASFFIKIYTSVTGAELPLWADSNVLGIIVNVIVLIVVSALTKVTPEEKAMRESLFIIPESEKDPEDAKKTLRWVKYSVIVGPTIAIIMILCWGLPYFLAVH